MTPMVVSSTSMIFRNLCLSAPVESLDRTFDINASNSMTMIKIGAAAGATRVGMISIPSRATIVPGAGRKMMLIIARPIKLARRKPSDLINVI